MLKVGVANCVVPSTANEHAHGAVDEIVPLDEPPAHLVVQIDGLNVERTLLACAEAVDIADVGKAFCLDRS